MPSAATIWRPLPAYAATHVVTGYTLSVLTRRCHQKQNSGFATRAMLQQFKTVFSSDCARMLEMYIEKVDLNGM